MHSHTSIKLSKNEFYTITRHVNTHNTANEVKIHNKDLYAYACIYVYSEMKEEERQFKTSVHSLTLVS